MARKPSKEAQAWQETWDKVMREKVSKRLAREAEEAERVAEEAERAYQEKRED